MYYVFPCDHSFELEKAASGAKDTCRLFVIDYAILRTFEPAASYFLLRMGKKRVEDGELRLDKRDLW